jgi:cardiolipin synthase
MQASQWFAKNGLIVEAIRHALLGRDIQAAVRLVHYTCRSYLDGMLAAGIRIFGFKGGLLHTKSVVVDRQVALFGSVNLDVRSFWLDFEVTLGVYDPDFAQQLLALQDKYIEDSTLLNLQT